MIGLSTLLFDTQGVELFHESVVSDFDNKISRRVTSTPTLDGGSYVSDQGYSDSDKIISFKVSDLSQDRVDNLKRISKLHSRVWLCIDEGAFIAVIKQIYYANGLMNIVLVVVDGA